MLIVDHKDHDKTNIQEFLLNSMAKYTFFTLKTLVLDYLENILEIRRSNATCFEFESYYKKYLYKISHNLKKMKEKKLITKYNSRAWKVNKEKIRENDLNIHEVKKKEIDFDVLKFVDELRKNGLKVKIKSE